MFVLTRSMEDPESKTLVGVTDIPSPLTLCSVVFRMKHPTLAMREYAKLAAAILALQLILSIVIVFMRPVWDFPVGRWFPIFAALPTCLLYAIMYANLLSGPWGSESSRFWCDVRIMYARGFNTIRNITRMISISILFMFLSVLLGHRESITLSLLFLIGVVVEWQNGIAENVNQDDVKVFDRFVNNGVLCLETLNHYQMQNKTEIGSWSAFVTSVVIRLYTITCLLCTSLTHEPVVFQVPIAIVIVLYTCIIPSVIDFVYFKGIVTFCQTELYRACADVICLGLILSFAMV